MTGAQNQNARAQAQREGLLLRVGGHQARLGPGLLRSGDPQRAQGSGRATVRSGRANLGTSIGLTLQHLEFCIFSRLPVVPAASWAKNWSVGSAVL